MRGDATPSSRRWRAREPRSSSTHRFPARRGHGAPLRPRHERAPLLELTDSRLVEPWLRPRRGDRPRPRPRRVSAGLRTPVRDRGGELRAGRASIGGGGAGAAVAARADRASSRRNERSDGPHCPPEEIAGPENAGPCPQKQKNPIGLAESLRRFAGVVQWQNDSFPKLYVVGSIPIARSISRRSFQQRFLFDRLARIRRLFSRWRRSESFIRIV